MGENITSYGKYNTAEKLIMNVLIVLVLCLAQQEMI